MSKAVIAQHNGHDYQARLFWVFASALRDSDQANVVEVTYEADAPKAFDDVVVRYDPPRRSSGPVRISVDYHQIKWHVNQSGRFGYEDLVDPKFISGTANSLLERLAQAKSSSPDDAAFKLITTDKILDGDPLNDILSNDDESLLVDRLFDSTGDGSRMGKVRKLWREHLRLATNEDLRKVVTGLHIESAYHTLDKMRERVNERFRLVGLVSDRDSMEFKFDGVARRLKAKGIHRLDRSTFAELCVSESWIRPDAAPPLLNASIKSFRGSGSADHLDVREDRELSLVPQFVGRKLADGRTWSEDVQPKVVTFLKSVLEDGRNVRLFLDCHASIAFLAGSVLGTKSGAAVEVVQKGGRANTTYWRDDDGRNGPSATVSTTHLADDLPDIAVVVSLSREALADVEDYVKRCLPTVGRIIHATPADGPGRQAIAGGAHAAALADQIADAVRQTRRRAGAAAHLFVSAPNAFTFYLGQNQAAMGLCFMYEFDFNNTVDGSYLPTFKVI